MNTFKVVTTSTAFRVAMRNVLYMITGAMINSLLVYTHMTETVLTTDI